MLLNFLSLISFSIFCLSDSFILTVILRFFIFGTVVRKLIMGKARNLSCVMEMSNRKIMGNLDKLDKLLRQNPHGIRIRDIVTRLGISRSTVYNHLNHLDLKGKAYYERGTAYPKKPSHLKLSKAERFELLKEIIRANALIESAELEAISRGERQ